MSLFHSTKKEVSPNMSGITKYTKRAAGLLLTGAVTLLLYAYSHQLEEAMNVFVAWTMRRY